MQKGFTPVYILIGVLIIVALGGAYYLGQNSQKTVVSQNPVVASPTPPVQDGTATWKTYISAVGFSVKYPQDWSSFEIKGGESPVDELERVNFGTEQKSFVTIIVAQNQCDEPDAKTCLYQSLPAGNQSLKIDDLMLGIESAKQASVTDYSKMPFGFNGADRSVITSHKGKNYTILLSLNKTTETNPWTNEEYSIFNQILSTFKFN